MSTKNNLEVKTLRTFLSSMKDQNCSLMAKYSDPIRKLAESLNTQLGTVLAALPADDTKGCEWCTEDVLNSLFCCLNNADAICKQLGLELSKIGQTTAAPEAITAAVNDMVTKGDLIKKDALQTHIEAAIKTKVDAGELVPKTTVDQLCSQSKVTGIEEGKQAAKTEAEQTAAAEKLAGTRREGLTQAGLPLPPAEVEALLRGSEEDFNGARKRFDDREAELAKDGITLASSTELRANLWLDDAAYKGFAKLARSIPALRSTADPLAAPAQPGNKPAQPGRMLA